MEATLRTAPCSGHFYLQEKRLGSWYRRTRWGGQKHPNEHWL